MVDVLQSVDFWCFFGLNIAVFVFYRCGLITEDETDAKMDWSLDFNFVKVSTAITTFFEVFYSNQSYGKYQKLYDATKNMFDEATTCAHILRVWLKGKCPNHARLSARYLAVSMMLHFLHMKGKNSESDMPDLFRSKLLRQSEWECLRGRDGSHWSLIVLSWANEVAADGLRQVGEKNAVNPVTQGMMKVHAKMQLISDSLALPVPFAYYHLLCVMVASNIVLWAWSMGTTHSIFGPLVFWFCCSVFLGMMKLSSALGDPFGSDEVDFPIDEWFLEFTQVLFATSDNEFLDGGLAVEDAVSRERFAPRLDSSLVLLGQVPEQERQGNGRLGYSPSKADMATPGADEYTPMRSVQG